MTAGQPRSATPPADGTDHAQVAFHPPLLLLALLGAGFVLRWITPIEFLPALWAATVGPPIVLAAFILFAWAVVTMRSAGASIPTAEPTARLVFAGPFRYSRNPIYLSMVMLLLGTAISSNSLWFLICAIVMATLLNWGVIAREERYLEHKFGDDYTAYRRSVRRWI